uniref:C2H2-type domain-containing protein n=1 Tax=Knipowitschia caucasica TaxID=637954 RepID=A0AAV2LNG8_KNICA
MAEVKLEQTELCMASPHLKEESELWVKQEPEEFPFHVITVKIEDDEDKSSVLQRPTEDSEEHSDSSEDTDHSKDYSQEQPPAKSYSKIPADSCVTVDKPFSCSDCGKRFKRKQCVKRHMVVHSDERHHKCSVCEKRLCDMVIYCDPGLSAGEKKYMSRLCLNS